MFWRPSTTMRRPLRDRRGDRVDVVVRQTIVPAAAPDGRQASRSRGGDPEPALASSASAWPW
jgi:hypothetical protein